MIDDKPRLHITSSFIAEPLAEPLAFWTESMGWPWRFSFSGFKQVFQDFLDPNSALSSNRNGANLLLFRPSDFEQPEAVADELIEAWHATAGAWHVPLLAFMCPSRIGGEAEGRAIRRLTEVARDFTNIEILSFDEALATYNVRNPFDETACQLAAIPYSTEAYAALATMSVRTTCRLQRIPYKVIALDCDNTLWDGVVGEDGPSGINVDEVRTFLQTFMLVRRDEGFLLCLCSKNAEADIDSAFEENPDMPLKPDHITARQIGWNTKSSGIVELGKMLGLHPDSFILIDDNPLECAEVTSAIPGALAIHLPDDKASIPVFLSHVWAFDRGDVTDADRRRAEMYGEAVQREQNRKHARTLSEFLDSLALEIDIHPLKPNEITRASQLIQRVNQFNFSTTRRSIPKINQFLGEMDAEGIAVHVRDRFGDYGFVGVTLYRLREDVVDIDTFLLSCRALGRGVEHRMLAKLASIGLDSGCPHLRLTHVQTAQNNPALKFLRAVAKSDDLSLHEKDGITRRHALLSCKELIDLCYRPGATDERRASSSDADMSPPSTRASNWFDDNVVASRLNNAEAVVNAMRRHQSENRPASNECAQDRPEGVLEQTIAEIWRKTLILDTVGRNDDFFLMGGTSLKAIEVIVRIRQHFDIELSVETFFASPTVRLQALAVDELSADFTIGEL